MNVRPSAPYGGHILEMNVPLCGCYVISKGTMPCYIHLPDMLPDISLPKWPEGVVFHVVTGQYEPYVLYAIPQNFVALYLTRLYLQLLTNSCGLFDYISPSGLTCTRAIERLFTGQWIRRTGIGKIDWNQPETKLNTHEYNLSISLEHLDTNSESVF